MKTIYYKESNNNSVHRPKIKYLNFILATFILFSIAISIYLIVSKPNNNDSNVLTNKTISVETELLEATSTNETKEIKILFVGDIMVGRTIGDNILLGQNPFQYTKETLLEYDLVVGNLETNVSYQTTPQFGKLYTFNAPVESLQILKNNNISLVSLANNHSVDYGTEGLLEEMTLLNNARIGYFGAGSNIYEAFNPKIITIDNTKIAFIGLNGIENWYTNADENSPGTTDITNIELINNSIVFASQNADIIIVVPHWGQEYSLFQNADQINNAYFYINNGADIVIGGHPHVTQGEEEYNGKKIYYSLGNFVFDEMPYIENAGNGLMVEVVIKDGEILSSRSIPIYLSPEGYPILGNYEL